MAPSRWHRGRTDGAGGGAILARKLVALAFPLVVLLASCSDTGHNLVTKEQDRLVVFKRVTVATESPDRAEIEIEVRTGPHFSHPAPDGTPVVIVTSLGSFLNGESLIESATEAGRTVVILKIPNTGALTLTARVRDTEADLTLLVRPDGSLACSSRGFP